MSSLQETAGKGQLTDDEVHRVKEIEKLLTSEQADEVEKDHLQLLGLSVYLFAKSRLTLNICIPNSHSLSNGVNHSAGIQISIVSFVRV